MKSCNRGIVSVLLLLTACGAETPDLFTASIQNVGLVQASGVPSLGEGIPPSTGREGDGAAIVTQVGGWSSGPGAVRWHGGQWVVPYSGHPGATLANASCDIAPRADATALVELVSSNGQVLGSSTVPATTANVVIRAWVVLNGHVLLDGEQVVMRVSPRDAATGAWTSAAQDMTVISCAVNSSGAAGILQTLQISPMNSAFTGIQPWNAGIGSGGLTIGLPMKNGDQIVGLRARIKDALGMTFHLSLQSVVDGVPATVATGSASAGTATVQTLSLTTPAIIVVSGTNYQASIDRLTGSGLSSVYWIEADVIPQ